MKVKGVCDQVIPEMIAVSPNHDARCLMYDASYQEVFMPKEISHA
jgi:hypothetical protein